MSRARQDLSDRLPPHSTEAEQGVLGCMLISPNGCIDTAANVLGPDGEPFFDLRNRMVFKRIVSLHDHKVPVDMVTLTQSLNDTRNLEEVGGITYLAALSDSVPSSANLSYYLDIVTKKFLARRAILAATDIVSGLYETNGDDQAMVSRAQSRLLDIMAPMGRSVTQEHWRLKDLIAYDASRDPNAVIGMKDGKATRYLCKGYGAWLIGPSGIGKSTLGQQLCYHFALQRALFGMNSVRPLRCLIVQNENDQGDCAEAAQGILKSGRYTSEEIDMLHENTKIIRCRGKTGPEFCRWFEGEVGNWSADISDVDPMLRFAGIDVSRQDQCTKFLNDHLDPVLARTGVVMLGTHHTGKPKKPADMRGQTIYDQAYAGLGSSELVNWARAIMILTPRNDGTFELLLAKRGNRAWATHPNGDPTTSIYLRHTSEHIYWEQIEPPEDRPERGRSEKTIGGRPSKIQEIASMNLHSFCEACKTEGEGEALNEIAKRLEKWLGKERVDVSFKTCQRAIPALVANGKITKKEDSTYTKGPNA